MQTFFKAYTEAHGRAKAYQEIMDNLASAESKVAQVTKAMDPKVKYEI